MPILRILFYTLLLVISGCSVATFYHVSAKMECTQKEYLYGEENIYFTVEKCRELYPHGAVFGNTRVSAFN